MAIKFTQEQIDSFITTREEDLALLNWNRLKVIYPDLTEKYFNNDVDKGVKFLEIAHTRVKKYLTEVEDDDGYNQWRTVYGEICFILNDNKIDDDPWNRGILEERLWPHFLRIDILAGVLESSLNNPDSQKFYAALEKQKWG
ncbi:hypothetical protein [Acinetobacter lanii]|uniref:Uncharacterized protein n=1 Tax=Acinetobacter lanii TaxID=2715163 RepID=A0A6G8S4T3_9GAMM|nr:hypothetical protein [Acinetobacter lanii]QIO09177.1 hypothetical protein G8D99_09220 [Acinetobacter lanii]